MNKLRLLQFQEAQGLQDFLQRVKPGGSQEEPGIGNDRTLIIAVYFDSISAMHTVVYEEDLS